MNSVLDWQAAPLLIVSPSQNENEHRGVSCSGSETLPPG